MISKELEVKIKTLRQNEKWKIGGIAKELGIHPDVVKRVLGASARPKFDDVNAALRVSVLDAWLPLIEKILEEHPQIKATRILDMLKSRGYSGSVYPIRNVCRMKRSSSNKAYLDLQFMPGEMAQVDWASFGSPLPDSMRKLKSLAAVVFPSEGRKQAYGFLRGFTE